MAINYYANIGLIGSDIEFNYNELLLPVVDNETSAPATGNEVIGQMYMDVTSKIMKFYNGTSWVSMDGSGSGVSGFTNANGTFVSAAVVNTNAKGLVSTGVIDLSATGTPGGTTFLRGDNVWATPAGSYTSWSLEGDTGTAVNITDGLRVDFTGGTGISTAVSTATPNLLTITNTGVTSIVAGTNVTISGATGAVTVNSTDQFQGTVKSVEVGDGLVKTGTAVDPIISVDYSGTGIINDAPTVGAADPDDYIILGDDSDGDAVKKVQFTDVPLNVLGPPTGTVGLNNKKIGALASGTASTDAVNLGQVQGLVAGIGLFKGGYNATTGLTTDLGAGNGSLDGASNIALDLGDFFVVTTGGTAFYTETLEIGDTIYANQDITASSTPAQSAYTVVIQDQNVAGEGASDGATQKGVAGFDSATFSVTANGFVTSDIYGGASTLGVVPSGGGATTFLRGDGSWVVPTDTNTQRAAGTGLSLNTNTIDANVNATVQTVAKAGVSATADRTYELQVDSSDQLVVNVPWTAGSDTGVTSVTLALGASTGVPLDAAIVGRALNLTSKSYAGTTRVGYVPSGGTNTTFLRGDGTWVTPTDSTPVDSVTAATNADLDGMSVTPTTGAVVVGLDIDSLTVESAPIADESYVAVRTDDAGNVKTLIQDLLQLHTFKSGTVTAYGAITHSLGTFDVMVQIYDETTKDTIHMEVERNSVNQVTISGTGTFPSGGVIVLVSRIG